MKTQYTLDEKLAAVETVIERLKTEFGNPATDEQKMLVGTLSSIAMDLRGRSSDRCHSTLQAIDRRINIARINSISTGYQNGHLIGVAQELIGRWPTVRQALEKFEQETADV